MAKQVITNEYFLINAVDLSDHVQEAPLVFSADVVDVSAMGATAHDRLGGLKDWSIDAVLFQDYAAGKTDATLNGIVGTVVAIEVRPTTGARSATNPAYTGNALVVSYQPVAGKVGDAQMAQVKLQGAGALTRQTS